MENINLGPNTKIYATGQVPTALRQEAFPYPSAQDPKAICFVEPSGRLIVLKSGMHQRVVALVRDAILQKR